MGVEYAAPAGDFVGMGMFVMSRKRLMETIQETVPHGKYHLERDFIMESFNKNGLKVNVYPFEGAALFNQSVISFYKNNMGLYSAVGLTLLVLVLGVNLIQLVLMCFFRKED